jgi:hypothetical protein
MFKLNYHKEWAAANRVIYTQEKKGYKLSYF